MNPNLMIFSNDGETKQLVQQLNEEFNFRFSINISFILGDAQVVAKALNIYPIVIIDLDSTNVEMQREILSIGENIGLKKSCLVLIKSNPKVNEIREFLKSGAFDFLTKPLTKADMYYLLHELVAEVKKKSQSSPVTYCKETISRLKSGLAYDLVFGRIKSPKEVWDRCKQIGLVIIPNIALVVHIDDFHKLTENKSKQWEHSIRHEVIEGVQRFLNEMDLETLVIGTAKDKITVLLASGLKNSQAEYKISTKLLAQKVKNHITEYTGYTITVGVGNYYEDARNLHISYQEAYRAQENKFYLGKNTVTHIDDVKPFVNEAEIILNYDILPLANKVTVGDFTGVQSEVSELKNVLFSQKNLNPQVFHLQITDILTTLARAAIHGGAKPKDVFATHFLYGQELKNLENIDDVKQWFGKAIENMLEQVLLNHNEQMLRSVQKAIKYIDLHFLQHITLEEISSYVSLSANYFSNIFKKTTGYSFVEYVSRLRIERAKVMLMDLNYTVYQIATTIGYNDSRYFGRVFKTAVGKTPTQYRNSLIGIKFTDRDEES